MKKKMKRKKRNGLRLITLMVMIICGVVLYRTRDLEKDVKQKDQKIEKLNHLIEEQSERTLTLEEKKAFQSTKRYIEEVARTKLGLYYPDEIIVKEEP